MIETRLNITLKIDTDTFDITVRELSSGEKKVLEEIAKEHRAILDEQSAKEKKIEENAIAIEAAQRIIEVNKEILPLSEIKDKLALFIEIKKEGLNITRLKCERLNLERADFSKSDEALEKIYKKRFEFLVSGECIEALKKAIDEKGISYQNIFNDINKEISDAMKKKSIGSEDGQSK